MKRIVLLLAGLTIFAGAILYLGKLNLAEVGPAVFNGAFGTPENFGAMLKETTPLLGCGIAVFVALRAGLFNIGVEGQFMMGAMLAAIAGIHAPGPIAVPAAILAGAIGGGLWALPAAWIKSFRGGHEVITTIMFNEIARHFSTAMLAGPLKDPKEQFPTTAELPQAAALPALVQNPLISSAWIIIIVGLIGFAYWLRKTVKGYELEAVGINPSAAMLAGISSKNVTFAAMQVSGAIAGIAGAIQVLAYEHRAYEGFSQGFGFDSLGVALLAGSNPFGLIPSAFIFGALKQGFISSSIMYGVPKGMSTLLIGLCIIAFAAFRYRRVREAIA